MNSLHLMKQFSKLEFFLYNIQSKNAPFQCVIFLFSFFLNTIFNPINAPFQCTCIFFCFFFFVEYNIQSNKCTPLLVNNFYSIFDPTEITPEPTLQLYLTKSMQQ